MLTKEQIKEILPHRDPFLFIDEVIELIPEKKAVAIKYVKEDEYFFKGHFPKTPVMPGVLIVEALAQVGGIIALSLEQFSGKIAYLAGVNNVKFRQPVLPGDTLRLECEIEKIRANIGFGYGKAYVGETLVCEGKMSFAIK